MASRMKFLAPPLLAPALVLAACGGAGGEGEQEDVTVQIAEGPRNAIEVLGGNEDFSSLTTAIEAAGLSETLTGSTPVTIFAPNNAAFDQLGDGALDDLLKPENRPKMTGLLTYHILPGKTDAAALAKMIDESGGSAELGTVNGGKISATMDGEEIVLADEAGGTARITSVDIDTSNGTIHAIDSVVSPSTE